MLACACDPKPVDPDNPDGPNTPEVPDTPDVPDKPAFKLDSFNGQLVKGLAGAYDTFLETGTLPKTINVDGLPYSKNHYIYDACVLIEKIVAEPDTWQDEDLDTESVAGGDEYRFNTYDLDTIDWAHIQYLASRMRAFADKNGQLPNYVTFPSDDTSSQGYLPKLMMVVTEHDNMMNLRAAAVVLTRTFNYFVEHEGEWPAEVSSWPSDYMGPSRNCPTDAPEVKAALDAALAGLASDATARQKAEAIFAYTRDEWEWENYMNTKKGAVKTIQEKGGNCCDLTHATLAMCHAAGIPARYLHGQCFFSSGIIGHVIPEIYVDGKWWICDPSNNNAQFGTPTWKGMDTFNGRYYELEF